MLKLLALVLGFILAIVVVGWTFYMSNTPDALPNNASLLLVLAVAAISLIAYGRSRDRNHQCSILSLV